MDTHARRDDPESSHLTSEINQEARGSIEKWLLDAMVRHLKASFMYRQGQDLITAARAAPLADFQIADRAGYVYGSGKWKRCSDLRKKHSWAEFLYHDGHQVKILNPHTEAMVGVSILTFSGMEAWADWMNTR